MNKKTILQALIVLAVSLFLYVLSRMNYLLFHGIAEVYSIVIAAGIFIVSWNTRKISENDDLVYLGIVYLFAGFIDFFHTLSYKGMNVLNDDIYYANQLWVGARFIEGTGLFIFAIYGRLKRKISPAIVFTLYMTVTALFFLSVFFFKTFPACFVDGKGQTLFKITAEYIICIILLIALIILNRKRSTYDPLLYKQVVLSIILTIFSEIFFTLYTDNFGITNVLGHILKIMSFYLIYKSVIVNTLERPYDILYQRMTAAKKSAETANETKNKFFRIIAHDLRNPFNVIIGFGGLLKEQCSKCHRPENLKYIELINNSSEAAYKLLENLLKWSMAQTKTINFRPATFNISEKIKAVLSVMGNTALFKNITIKNNIPDKLFVYGDMDMIDTIIRNLMSNSLKFTHPGGTIEITGETRDRFIQINITDSGIGMDKDRADNLFSLDLKQSQPGTGGETGSGLGLILCKEFVEWNKGSIWVKSELHKGTTFSFTVPESMPE